MDGTQAQIEWAEKIQAGFVERWQKGLKAMDFVPSRHRADEAYMAAHEVKLARQRAIIAAAEQEQSAAFWIDNRTQHIDEIAELLVSR